MRHPVSSPASLSPWPRGQWVLPPSVARWPCDVTSGFLKPSHHVRPIRRAGTCRCPPGEGHRGVASARRGRRVRRDLAAGGPASAPMSERDKRHIPGGCAGYALRRGALARSGTGGRPGAESLITNPASVGPQERSGMASGVSRAHTQCNETVSRIPASPAFQSLQPPGPGGPTGRIVRCGRQGVARPVRTRPSPCCRGRQRRSAYRLLGATGEDPEPVLQADQALREATSTRRVRRSPPRFSCRRPSGAPAPAGCP